MLAARSIDRELLGADFKEILGVGVPVNGTQAIELSLILERSEGKEKNARLQDRQRVDDVKSPDTLPDHVDLSSFASIEELGWNQMPRDSLERELSGIVRYRVVNRVHDNLDLQFGLENSHMRVVARRFDITRRYCSEADRLPVSYVVDEKNEWYSVAPVDNNGMLRGRAVSGPLCTAKCVDEENANLRLDIFARSADFALVVTDLSTKERIRADNAEARNLIEKLFSIYLRKLSGTSSEEILLNTASVRV